MLRNFLIVIISFPFFLQASGKEEFLSEIFSGRPQGAIESLIKWEKNEPSIKKSLPYLLHIVYQLKKNILFGDPDFIEVLEVIDSTHPSKSLIEELRESHKQMWIYYWVEGEELFRVEEE